MRGRSFLSTVRLKPAATSPGGGCCEGDKANEEVGEEGYKDIGKKGGKERGRYVEKWKKKKKDRYMSGGGKGVKRGKEARKEKEISAIESVPLAQRSIL